MIYFKCEQLHVDIRLDNLFLIINLPLHLFRIIIQSIISFILKCIEM